MLNTFKIFSLSLFTIFFIAGMMLTLPSPVHAGTDQCTYDGQCINNQKCRCVGGNPNACGSWIFDGECGSAIIGGVSAPQGVSQFTFTNGVYNQVGILAFVSVLIKLLTIIAGIWTMINFVIAGFEYIASMGNTATNAKVRDRLTWSVVGLVVIISAYALAGMIGILFFNDATYILNPKLDGAI